MPVLNVHSCPHVRPFVDATTPASSGACSTTTVTGSPGNVSVAHGPAIALSTIAQRTSPGVIVTVPLPCPPCPQSTVVRSVAATAMRGPRSTAVTESTRDAPSAQSLVPAHAPCQPANSLRLSAAACSVSSALAGCRAADLTRPASRTVTVAASGKGAGFVSSQPIGIACRVERGVLTGACSARFDAAVAVGSSARSVTRPCHASRCGAR